MRNKVAKRIRKMLKPLIQTGVLTKEVVYEDKWLDKKFLVNVMYNEEGEAVPQYKKVKALHSRKLAFNTQKHHTKVCKKIYRSKEHGF